MNSDDTPPTESRLGRALIVLGGLALSAFFFGLLVLIVSSPVDGPPVARWSLRAFITLMFGTIGLFGLSPLGSWAREAWLLRDLGALEGRCPGCGARDGASNLCERCGHPVEGRRAHWTIIDDVRLDVVLGVGVFGAILSLGVFMAYWSLVGRGWFEVVFGGLLALLLVVVGLAGFAAGVASLWDKPQSSTRLHFARAWEAHGASANTSVDVGSGPDGCTVRGSTRWNVRDHEQAFDAGAATPFERGLACKLAGWEADGALGLVHDRSLEWTLRLARAPAPKPVPGVDTAYRSASWASEGDGVERVERDGWFVHTGEMVTASVYEELSLAELERDGVTALAAVVRALYATDGARAAVEACDPGAAAFEADVSARMTLRAVLDSRG